jgi:hypothetical protein
MMKNKGDDMNFELFSTTAIDIVRAWQSTNAEKEVTIIENTLGRFELWVACDLIAQLSSFDEAKRFAECAVTFTMDRGTKVA